MKPRNKRERAIFASGFDRGQEALRLRHEDQIAGMQEKLRQARDARMEAFIKLANSVGQAMDAQSKMIYGLGQTLDNFR